MIMMSATELLAEVNRLQREYPNAVYNQNKIEQLMGTGTCCYSKGVVGNGPETEGCIIGQAIRKLYPINFDIIAKKHDNVNICDMQRFFYSGTHADLDGLERIQNDQDKGNPWGKCGASLKKSCKTT